MPHITAVMIKTDRNSESLLESPDLMRTTRWTFHVEPRHISYIRYTLETYDGMLTVTTLDPALSVIELNIAPGFEDLAKAVLHALEQEEGIKLCKNGALKTFFIKTMGCQMNEYDSDYVAQLLINNGLVAVNTPEKADLILVNTCTVRAKPDQKAYSFLGRIHPLKQKNRNIVIGVMGCLAQKQGKSIIDRFPYVDMVIGTREIGRVAELYREIANTGKRKKAVATSLDKDIPSSIFSPGYFQNKVTGFISIMQGCNNFCTYCNVPYVRGREICRPVEDIVKETENLVSQGIKDITLLGQNVNSYTWKGKTGKRHDFASLLKEISQKDGLCRLRFTTSHPKDLSDRLIFCFAELGNLCNHIHLPFQSGSNSILSRMKRGYTREQYLDLTRKLREAKEDIAITSDVIVGFPGETDQDFEMTLDLVRQVQFDSLFSFKYSDRKGTVAEKMDPKVQEEEKSQRLVILQKIQQQITLQKNRMLEGSRQEVLVEGFSKRGKQFSGRTTTGKIVNFSSDNTHIGDIVNVLIKRASVNSLLGEKAL